MASVRYAVRKSRRARGKRYQAQAEFPGGRVIKLGGSRTRPPAVRIIRQEVRAAAQAYAKGTGDETNYGSGGVPPGRNGESTPVLQ